MTNGTSMKTNQNRKMNYLNSAMLALTLACASGSLYAAEGDTPPAEEEPKILLPVCTDSMNEEQCQAAADAICNSPSAQLYADCIPYLEERGLLEEADPNKPTSEDAPPPPMDAGIFGDVLKAVEVGQVGMQLVFSPASFAAQQAIGFVQQVFTCKTAMSEEEKSLAMRRGANLCIHVGDYCSKKVKIGFIKACRTKKKTFCCFNSTLSRIINVEGRKQLAGNGVGKSYGSAEAPDCTGFTLDEFNTVDIGKMDLTEFVNEVTAKAQTSAANSRSGDYWDKRNQSRVTDSVAVVDGNTDNLAEKILTANDPYQTFKQRTDGTARVNQELAQRSPLDKVVNETYESDVVVSPRAITANEKIRPEDNAEGKRQYRQWLTK